MRTSAIIIDKGPRVTVKTDCLIVGRVIPGLLPRMSVGMRLTNYAKENLDTYINFMKQMRRADYVGCGTVIPKSDGVY